MRRTIVWLSLVMAMSMTASLALANPQRQVSSTETSRAEEVGIAGTAGTLAGTFSRPHGKGPFPAVVLIAGSGPNDRDQTSNGRKPFLVLAEALNAAGIAVLRYDKRGVGASQGDFASATMKDFAADAGAAVSWLQTRSDVAKEGLGVIGNSEGGYIAPILAAENPGVRFIVLLSSSGLRRDEASLLQQAAIARSEGMSEGDIAAKDALYRQVFAVVMAAKDASDARTQPEAMAGAAVAGGQMSRQEAEAGIAGLTSPWGFETVRHDPAPVLAKVRVPVLAVSGSLDVQAPAKAHFAGLRSGLRDNPDVTLIEVPGVNHQLQTAVSGAPSEYDQIAEPLSPEVLRLVTDWIARRVR